MRRRPEETTLVDRGWHALMFEERAKHSLESLARRMSAARKESGDGFEAFNRLGPHVQFAARAHMEQVILASFVKGIEGTDGETRDVLERLCSLYALDSIHKDRAWFLEHHRISAVSIKGARGPDRCALPGTAPSRPGRGRGPRNSRTVAVSGGARPAD